MVIARHDWIRRAAGRNPWTDVCVSAVVLGGFVVVLLGAAPGQAQVCGDGILQNPDQCDPTCPPEHQNVNGGCNLYVNGSPSEGGCVNGNDCFFAFSCCKFNCNYVGQGATCDDANECTSATVCDQYGQCANGLNVLEGTPCGSPDADECDGADTCSASGVCLSNIVAEGTSAPTLCADAAPCTADECDGSGGCQNPALADGEVCRAAVGACDSAETCVGGSCPADGLIGAGSECRAVAGACDVAESCTGTDAACPDDIKRTDQCRASTDLCDAAELCDGSGDVCPPDVLSEAGVECRPAAGGSCDLPEVCTGADAVCPPDVQVAEGEICDDGDDCTVDDLCSGGVCVADTEVAVFQRAKLGRTGQLNDDLAVHDPAGIAVFAVAAVAADDTAVTAGRVRLGRASSIFDARTSVVVGRGEIRGTESPFPALQDFATRYPDPTIACSGPAVVVATDGTVDLTPGNYGEVAVDDRGVLHLAAGVYSFCSLTAYNEGQILVTSGAAPTTLEVAGNLRTGFGVRIASEGSSPPPILRVAGSSVFFRNDNDVVAHIYAPDAAVRVGRGTIMRGSIVADSLVTKVAAEIACELH